MDFDLDQRTASLSVGEFASFTTGPRDSTGGAQGIWRAQLGTHWHNALRDQAITERPDTEFEIPITGRIAHHGWTLTLTGRIDQLVRDGATVTLREIKTVTRELPADESELRSAYPEYFAQLAAYVALARQAQPAAPSPRALLPTCQPFVDIPPERTPRAEPATGEPHVSRPETGASASSTREGPASADKADARSPAAAPEHPRRQVARAELVFVEVSSGLAQTIVLDQADDRYFRIQLERVAEFLDLRHRARERLRHLRFRPAFAVPRPGQETTQADLTAKFERHPLVLFEAPTGFGKTGVLLEFALGQLRRGHFDRALYLTSKSTGQIQVVRTLAGMTAAPSAAVEESKSKRGIASGFGAPPAASGTSASTSTSPFNSAVAEGGAIAGADVAPASACTPVAVWHVRNKAEHCINSTFHCVRDACAYLADAEARWPTSGLARFYLDEKHARDLDTLRAAGRDARICPYEITRAALAFNDVWIGDYNYVFAPRNRGLFFEQPGFDAARTLLLLDEAHNLPSRVADAYSHTFSAADAFLVRDELHRTRPLASLVQAWGHWCHFLDHLRANHGLAAADEDDALHLLREVAKQVASVPLDLAAMGPQIADLLWQVPALADELDASDLPRLWWSPQDRELALTCLDAAAAIGATLREFGGVVLASATLTPMDGFAAACGLDATGKDGSSSYVKATEDRPSRPRTAAAREAGRPSPSSVASAKEGEPSLPKPERLGALNKRDTKKLFRQLTSGAELLRIEEARQAAQPAVLRAHTPWREGSYDVAFDVRVDTTFQHRSHHFTTTAATIAALHRATTGVWPVGTALPAVRVDTSDARPCPDSHVQAQPDGRTSAPSSLLPVANPHLSPLTSQLARLAVFFPSYAYADAILRELGAVAPNLRAVLQPRVRDLAAQTAWVEESLRTADALFLVVGSSFAESIDALGGRISHAMVVGPALPEVNPVQHARLAEATRAGLSRDAAFRRVYQIPGMTKVNQALGRLVRAPGHRAHVLLHCRRFREASYLELLAPDYQSDTTVRSDAELAAWLGV